MANFKQMYDTDVRRQQGMHLSDTKSKTYMLMCQKYVHEPSGMSAPMHSNQVDTWVRHILSYYEFTDLRQITYFFDIKVTLW